jgi:hypothetical protein
LRRLDFVIRAGSVEFIINNFQFVINYYSCRSAGFFRVMDNHQISSGRLEEYVAYTWSDLSIQIIQARRGENYVDIISDQKISSL